MKAGDSVQQIPIPWNLKGKNNSSHHLFFCKKNNGEHNNWYNIFAVYLPNHGYSLLGTEASLKSGSNDTFQLVTTDDLEARWEDRMIPWVRVTVCHRCVSHFFVTDVCDIYIYVASNRNIQKHSGHAFFLGFHLPLRFIVVIVILCNLKPDAAMLALKFGQGSIWGPGQTPITSPLVLGIPHTKALWFL